MQLRSIAHRAQASPIAASAERQTRWAVAMAREQVERARNTVDDLRGQGGAPIDQYIVLNGKRFHFRDWGCLPGSVSQDPTLILLHGFTGTAHAWDGLAHRLRRNYRVLALDQRGHGESEWATDYSVDRFVEDLRAFADALQITQFTLVGNSMGGRNAYHFAGQFPERVTRLVLGDIGPDVAPAGRARVDSTAQSRDRFANSEEAIQLALEGNPRAQASAIRTRMRHSLMRLDDGRWTFRFDSALRSAKTPLPRPDPAQGWALLANITCPTLLLHGAESDLLASETAARMVGEMPDCRVVEIPDSGHPLAIDNPVAFEREILAFLT